MDEQMSSQEQQLCQFLMGLPAMHKYRYSDTAARDLLSALFWSMAGGREEYLRLFFPDKGGPARPDGTLKLREAQGAVQGAEFTEAARGKPCGHIFRAGEATYSCRTCSADDTCVLCARCFDSTDHTNHMVRISVSPGNSGCCDCGDPEAWKLPMFCTIHTIFDHDRLKGKGKESLVLTDDLVTSVRMTIGRVLDYLCDVISCSPEQLRSAKTAESIELDERMSRLSSTYGGGDVGPPPEYAVLLWNDEKHTVHDVRDQVARACKVPLAEGLKRAYETDSIGRSILYFSESIPDLLDIAKILEQIKVTVTIRSSRDTFREQMCGTMIEWLCDISGCFVGQDSQVLRRVVCEEMLKPWRRGSPANHAIVGENGMDDEDLIDQKREMEEFASWVAGNRGAVEAQLLQAVRQGGRVAVINGLARGFLGPPQVEPEDDDDDGDDDDDDGEDEDGDDADMAGNPLGGVDEDEDDGNGGDVDDDDDDVVMVDARDTADVAMDDWAGQQQQQQQEQRPPATEQPATAVREDETAMSTYPVPPPPPPPPSAATRRTRNRDVTPSDSDTAEPLIAPTVYAKSNIEVPKTPGVKQDAKKQPPRPGKYWLEVPQAYVDQGTLPVAEDLFQRVRLDWMVLFDLRMWKKVRNDIRSLYISTVVTIPEFKRVLGLRFAGLYTTLAQLYLIGDREPDHSIINISLQMLTTPSITAEVVERGNFLTTLMAILYTFLTMRQVAHPWDVSSNAVLAFDTGSVTNRRMYHFFMDLKYLFGSPHVQERLRTEERYRLQFLDLVKLHQGICPNTRAVGEHVEYETDTWINASLVTREINRLCRQFAESFRNLGDSDWQYLSKALRLAAKTVIINSIGAERARFTQAEIKDEVKFKTLGDFELDDRPSGYRVVKFVVEEHPISFHHALHYTLSWLVECAKSMPIEQLRALLSFTAQELKAEPRSMGRKVMPRREMPPEDYLMAAFDYPLRVCAWLSQMKAGMWVRNGISLRHQAGTYRGVSHRDVSHHRDIFLLQTAMVTCDPGRVLASVVDRFSMEKWVKGIFEQKSTAQDDIQHLDVVEDMLHLLIVILSDRTSLLPTEVEPNPNLMTIRRDVTHVLCFKPLSFSEICNKLPDKYQEQEDFHTVLGEIANFRFPEGNSDVGTFELKPQYFEDVDPYIAHYSKNQREESENAYRKAMAAKTGRPADDIVFEPKLRPIPSGVFAGLAAFTTTGMFAQVIYYSLLYPLVATKLTPNVPLTRIETYSHVVLHLILIAISEDKASGDEAVAGAPSFVENSLNKVARSNFMPDAPSAKTIVTLLDLMSTKTELKACHAKISLILKRMRQKRPRSFEAAYARLGISIDRISTASPASGLNAEEERERKKQAAKDRHARVMAQFQQQQQSFLESQADIDWGDVEDEEGEPQPMEEEQKNFWRYPTGTCLLCQEDTDERKLYGTFAFLTESPILRQTDLQDPDFVREALNTPKNLDRSAESTRPFGVARENRQTVQKVNSAGELFTAERQVIGKGFPARNCQSGPVSTGCGHIMHYACFEMYFKATVARHTHQIARKHPENTDRLEFVCPLCKALGNAFLPIIWKGHEDSYPGALHPTRSFASFLVDQTSSSPYYALSVMRPHDQVQLSFRNYTQTVLLRDLAEKSSQLIVEAWELPIGGLAGLSSRIPGVGGLARFFAPGPTAAAAAAAAAAESPRQVGSAPEAAGDMLKELIAVYRRLLDTLRTNKIASNHIPDISDDSSIELGASDVLARAVGYSISAVEIAQRGTDTEYGLTLLDKIPEQVLTHLRILAETVDSYISVGAQKLAGENRVDAEYRKDSERQHCQLFMGQYLGHETSNSRRPIDSYPPLLAMDPFVFLCESVFGVMRMQKLEIAHLMRLCYLAEITKVVYHMGRNMPTQAWISPLVDPQTDDPALRNFASFCLGVVELDMTTRTRAGAPSTIMDVSILARDSLGENRGFDQPGFTSLADYYSFVRRYALAFLRKCVVLLYVRFGVDFNSHVSPSPELEELDRLTEALRVPSFDEMCAALGGGGGGSAQGSDGMGGDGSGERCGWPVQATQQLVHGWIRHDVLHPRKPSLPSSALVSHPAIFELVGLPKNFDHLIEQCSNSRCPTTGKDVSDASICLLCGEVFCSQAICCLKEERIGEGRNGSVKRIGGCQQHMRKCQKNVGLFINIRKCSVFYLHGPGGSWGPAPFIDKYGEMDMGLRHGRQLFLNQKRYDSMLRSLWLGQGIPSFIARKLEADINNGGWETI
ncbi:hypothetical protein RB597_008076 [Gaeumannomyces tritici]